MLRHLRTLRVPSKLWLSARSLLRIYGVVSGFNMFKMGSVGLEFSKAVKCILQPVPLQ